MEVWILCLHFFTKMAKICRHKKATRRWLSILTREFGWVIDRLAMHSADLHICTSVLLLWGKGINKIPT